MSNFPFPAGGGDHLDLILATSEIGIWELDAATGQALRNLRHDQIFGHDTLLEEWSAEIFLGYVVETDRERVRNLLNAALESGSAWSFETQIRRADGADRWISARGLPKFSESGEVTKLIGHVIDITETKQNEERLKLLSRELNHRVANTFTIMNSMIRHAAKKTGSVDEFAATLTERLGALSRANRVLVAEEAERSSLRDILNMEMEAFAGWQGRISVTGDRDVWLSGAASEALAMIFHELLTNAIKHGALSVSGGQVAVDISTDAAGQVLVRWVEAGGPAIVEKRRAGIGSSILKNAMRDEGSVALDFSAEGLRCDITIYRSFRREMPDETVGPSDVLPVDRTTDAAGAFAGKRIMVVEDDPIIGLDLADIFRARGASIIGPFSNVANALQGIREAPDAALLDVNLGQETTDEVAAQLSDLSIPFLILSGQIDSTELGQAFRGAPIVRKPFNETGLVNQTAALID